MDLGKQTRVVEIPVQTPVRRTVQEPTRRDDGELIPLPDSWPKRSPARVPEKVEEWNE